MKFVHAGKTKIHRGYGYELTLLKDGSVLITGGQRNVFGETPNALEKVELYSSNSNDRR